VRPATGGAAPEPLAVKLTSLACGGIGLLAPRALPPGQQFHVSLPATENTTLHALCEGVQCAANAAGAHVVGARFVATFPRDPTADPSPAAT
jgi:hypothetical protein